jgi:quinol monooxygenase YgiN
MMIAHNVYFTLHDRRPAAVQAMIEDCHRDLARLPGIVFYAAGTCADADRSSSEADFDVALHVVFQDRAALDAYMIAPKHVAFMEKYEANWKDVCAFDSCVSGA